MRLFVANLPFDAAESDIKDAFAAHVGVDRVELVRDKFTGQSRGFGFVELISQEDAERALVALDGTDFMGRPLRVEIARSNGPRPGGEHRQDGDYRERRERRRS